MKTILVVDDMAVFREPIAAVLQRHGYRTLCAASARRALELAREHRPDLILLDLNLPDLHGLKLLEMMRREAALKAVPVVILSAAHERAAVLRARRLKVASYLLKSQFSLDDMLGRIDKHLAQAGQDRAVDLETEQGFEATPAPAVEGLEDVQDDMSPSEILRQVEQSDELKHLLEPAEVS